MLKKFWNVLKVKKGEILINIVLLFTSKTCIKIENSDFKMDSLQIERVIDCIETDNDLTVGRSVRIKGGQFVEGLSTNNQCVGRNIRRKAYSKLVSGKNSNVLYKKTTSPPVSIGGSITSSTELRVRGHSSNGDEKSAQNLNQSQKKCCRRTDPYVRKTDDNIRHELASQTRNKVVEIEVNDVVYKLDNSGFYSVDELCDQLAEKLYDKVRSSTSDAASIAENTGLKIENIERCKRHVFLDEHTLDRYPECIERKRFDPNLNQFLAWERLVDGIYLPEDIEWLKHEFAERHHELKFSSRY